MLRRSTAGVTCLLAIATALFSPTLLQAQGSVVLTPPDTPRWDAAAYTGWYGARKPGVVTWDDWLETGAGGGLVSFAWAKQFRTELDVSFAGTGRLYSQETVTFPGPVTTIVRTFPREYHDTTVAASLIFQPFENRWVHPFIGAGLGVVREHLRVESPEYRYFGPSGPVLLPAQRTTIDVTYHAEPHVVGGAKFYVSESAFIRTDMRFGIGPDTVSAVARIGFGFDF